MCMQLFVIMFAHAERMQKPGEDFECPALPSSPFKTRVSQTLAHHLLSKPL